MQFFAGLFLGYLRVVLGYLWVVLGLSRVIYSPPGIGAVQGTRSSQQNLTVDGMAAVAGMAANDCHGE